MNELQNILSEVLKKERRNTFTFLTGAGLSADSNIPTYRGTDGIWIKGTKHHKPEEFGTFRYFNQHPEEVWQYSMFRVKMFSNAQPNEGHSRLVEIESLLEDRFHLITQNVDGLHGRAGSKRMFEIHGNYREVKCAQYCSEILPMPSGVSGKDIDEDLSAEELELLRCPNCDEWLRPNILWFDERYNEKTHKLYSSLKVAKNSGVLFILGTSGATNLPMEIARTTMRYGGYIVDVNLEDNAFTDMVEDYAYGVVIRKSTTDFLVELKELLDKIVV